VQRRIDSVSHYDAIKSPLLDANGAKNYAIKGTIF